MSNHSHSGGLIHYLNREEEERVLNTWTQRITLTTKAITFSNENTNTKATKCKRNNKGGKRKVERKC